MGLRRDLHALDLGHGDVILNNASLPVGCNNNIILPTFGNASRYSLGSVVSVEREVPEVDVA